jgi:RNA polymerase sigma-70 factor (ECF subfamily)
MPRSDVHQLELHLVDQAAAGDRTAQRELFERHRDAAYRVALRITGRSEDALDAVQDAFIRALTRLDDFNRQAGFRTWLLRIVSNRALDLLRARKVRLAMPLDGSEDERGKQLADPNPAPGPVEQLERRELGRRLREAIGSLPPEQRAVLALYATGEMSYAEIAEALGVPIGTVMSRLYHARRRLHAMLPDLSAPAAGTAHDAKEP